MADAPVVQEFLRQGKALAFLADQVFGRDFGVLQDDLVRRVAHHGHFRRADLHARCFHVDDEAGNAAARALFRVGHGHDLREVGGRGLGDVALGAVDLPAIAAADRAGAHRGRVGTGVRLGLGKAGLQLAAQDGHQVAFAHFALQAQQDRADRWAEDPVVACRDGGSARDLFPEDGQGQQAQVRAAQLCRDFHQPEPGCLGLGRNFGFDFGGQLAVDRHLLFQRPQFLVDEAADGIPERDQLFRQVMVGHGFVHGGNSLGASCQCPGEGEAQGPRLPHRGMTGRFWIRKRLRSPAWAFQFRGPGASRSCRAGPARSLPFRASRCGAE